MLQFLTLKPNAFGLDISDLSVKIVKLKKRDRFLNLASFAQEPIEPGIIKAGEVRDEEKLSQAISKAVKKAKGEGLKTKYVIASLPEEKAFLQVIQMPRMPQEDLKSAVIYEAENYIPLPIEEVYLDSQIVKSVVNHLEHFDVLIAALPKKTIDPYLSCLRKAGLLVRALEIESLSLARALVKNEVSPYPLLLIDLGATRTSFIVFSGYSLRFTTSASISGQKFTELIAKGKKIDLQEAEQLKLEHGVKNKKVFEATKPLLTELVDQIQKYLSYYKDHSSHEHLGLDKAGIARILLSGGGANMEGLTDFLSLELKIPASKGNPWVNILPEPLKEVPGLSYEESLKYTTALGLALRGVS